MYSLSVCSLLFVAVFLFAKFEVLECAAVPAAGAAQPVVVQPANPGVGSAVGNALGTAAGTVVGGVEGVGAAIARPIVNGVHAVEQAGKDMVNSASSGFQQAKQSAAASV